MHVRKNPMQKNDIWGKIQQSNNVKVLAKYIREKWRLGQNTMEQSVKLAAKHITKKCSLGKLHWKKKTFGAKYIGEKWKGFGKTHYEKIHSLQTTMGKKAFGAKYNEEKWKGFGKTHCEKNHSGQNTEKMGRIHQSKKPLEQNTMEKGVMFSAKYIRQCF